MIRLLIAADADVNAADIDHNTAFTVSARYWNIPVQRHLLSAGADVHFRDRYQRTVLHKASYVEVLQVMLDAGVDINAVDSTGNTPLHVAASHGRHDLVKFLLKKGATTYLMNDDDQTAADLLERNVSCRDEADFTVTRSLFSQVTIATSLLCLCFMICSY